MKNNISGYTQLIGLIATPIKHSSSPKMHNLAFSKLGLDYVYLAFEIGEDELESTIKGFRAMNIRGFNVSMPNKTIINSYIDELSTTAKLCGAINTVVNNNGKLKGYMTDGIGYIKALEDINVSVTGKKVTIVGAGGVATAIQFQLALEGASEISIFNIKDTFYEKAIKNVKKINEITNCKVNLYDLNDLDLLKREILTSEILTNATNIGTLPFEGETYIPDTSFFKKDLVVFDVIYYPRETKLLKMAKEVGCKTSNGLSMMIFQGAEAFKIWTGHNMPIEYIKSVI